MSKAIAKVLRKHDKLRKVYVDLIAERNHLRAELDAQIELRDQALSAYELLVATSEAIVPTLIYLRGVKEAAERLLELYTLAHQHMPGTIQVVVSDPGVEALLAARTNNLMAAVHDIALEDEPPMEIVTTPSLSKLVH